ncbi:hypothetical protein BD01_0939 [Thermococcus nautili]|uniref:Uncharacterized protein n=1 Tax=Thermococcus nautili TaxID=195522 RepID=W8NTF9_9EURY|nr:hypothetical protein BD01_0939 [Thermococcus nautili]
MKNILLSIFGGNGIYWRWMGIDFNQGGGQNE